MNYLLRLLGFAEKEYHHIVDTFHAAVEDLDTLANREGAKAKSLADEIAAESTEKATAIAAELRATNAAKGIQKMLAGV